MTERELFESWFRTTDFYKNMIKSLIDHDYPIGALDRVGRKYKSIYVQLAFESWQAATQREGFRFVPVEPTQEMISSGMGVFSFPLDNGRLSDCELIFSYREMIGAVDD